jgi:riboflavin kinase/FMN adenylyltransferase
VREFALEGRVEGAAMLLGRPLEVTGEVVHGAGRGRGIGIPTANVKPEGELLPKPGIYAGRAVILAEGNGGSASSAHVCALSIGTNPTFNGSGALTIEGHLLDFDGDLYGRRVVVTALHRLRDTVAFGSVVDLLAAVADDVARTRALIG